MEECGVSELEVGVWREINALRHWPGVFAERLKGLRQRYKGLEYCPAGETAVESVNSQRYSTQNVNPSLG